MCVLELNKLFRVSSLAVLGTGVIVGEDGAVIDLIDKEKVSLPVLMKSSTEVRSKKFACNCCMYIKSRQQLWISVILKLSNFL